MPPKPFVCMPSDAVHDSYAGPGIGALGPCSQNYRAHHRIFRGIGDIVLRSIDPLLIFQRERLIFLRKGPEIFTPSLSESVQV